MCRNGNGTIHGIVFDAAGIRLFGQYAQGEIMTGNEEYIQLSFFEETEERPAQRVMWNLWHGCTSYVEDYIIAVMRFYSYVEQV